MESVYKTGGTDLIGQPDERSNDMTLAASGFSFVVAEESREVVPQRDRIKKGG